ncbi:dihydrofolate reductase family protein [Micromonospora sp. CPCC 206061]|uniref:dihydrofolate reductase family protein n=1 Tax=Micromonospora sp. CPCC 206061 TaxID=3122410 RepID=UPI002FF23558
MRLTAQMFLTLDGVYQGPGAPEEDGSGGFTQGGWLVPFFEGELGTFIDSVFGEVDAFLLGRNTYEIFAASWPNSTDPNDVVAAKLNTLPKYVASASLPSADWHNSQILSGDVVAAVTELKKQPGRELQLHGSGALVQSLLDAGLVDTLRLIVAPVVLGNGRRLLAEGRTPTRFALTEVRSTPTGVTIQVLDRVGEPEYGTIEVE